MLPTLARVAVALIAALHVYILVLEMFLWTTPRGHRAFGLTPDFARATKALAANQGLYNGFLVAGLVWSLIGSEAIQYEVRVFFLSCVVIAGIYGGLTAVRTILFAQAAPAIAALAVTMLAH